MYLCFAFTVDLISQKRSTYSFLSIFIAYMSYPLRRHSYFISMSSFIILASFRRLFQFLSICIDFYR